MRGRRLAVTAVVLAIGLAGPVRAQPSGPERVDFDRAVALMAADRHADAVAAFVAVADAAPGGRQAAEALFIAAQLSEERLADPTRALALYERLVHEHPDARPAVAAARRAEALRAELGPGGAGAAALARFQDVLQRFPERGAAASIARVEQLLADEPGWAGAPRAVLWLGDAHRRAGRLAAAEARYLEVTERWPAADQAADAWRGAGDVALARGALTRARAHYERMRDTGGPHAEAAFAAASAAVDRARLRGTIYRICFAAALIALLGLLALVRAASPSWAGAAAALARPPTEAIYFAPVAALLVGAALTGHTDIAPATAIIAAGGLTFTWLSGAGLTALRRQRGHAPLGRALTSATLACTGAVSVIYIALHRTRLVDLILETVRFGPDR